MRATERDRLLAGAGWIYLVGLAALTLYYLWPRPLPADAATPIDFGRLPVKKTLDLSAVTRLQVSAVGATKVVETRIRSAIEAVGGDPSQLTIPIDGDVDRLLDALFAMRKISREERYLTIVLRVTSGSDDGMLVRLTRGAFDDPDGRIGHALLERKKSKTSSTSEPSSP